MAAACSFRFLVAAYQVSSGFAPHGLASTSYREPTLGGKLLQQLVVPALRNSESLPSADSDTGCLSIVEDGDRSLAAHVPACRRCAHGRVETWPQEPSKRIAAAARLSGALVARATRSTALGKRTR